MIFTRDKRKLLILAGVMSVIVAGVVGAFLVSRLNKASSDDSAVSVPNPPKAAPPTDLSAGVPAKKPTEAFEAKVTAVRTGDLVTVQDNAKIEYNVRISGIVAPKLNEPFGIESKQNLTKLLLDKPVIVTPRTNEDDVLVSQVISQGKNAGLEQIKAGLAFRRPYPTLESEDEKKVFDSSELLARNNKWGVWAPKDELLAAGAMPQTVAAPAPYSVPAPLPEPRTPRSDTQTPAEVKYKPASIAALPTASSLKSAPAANAAAVQAPKPVSIVPEIKPVTNSGSTAGKVGPDGRTYTLGPRGGCFYMTPKGSKSYVDKSLCN